MAIPIILPAQPAWPRVLIVLAAVFCLWQAVGASGSPLGAEDACHYLARMLAASALATLALFFASERCKPLFSRYRVLNALDLAFLLAYYATAVLLWAAPPLLVGRSGGLLNGRPLPRPVALAVVYAAGLALYASRSLGAPPRGSAWLASLSGGAGLAAQALGVLLPGHALAARLQARYPHLPRALPHELSLQGLEAFVGWDGVAALGALAAGAALQYALFTPLQTVVVLGDVVMDEPVAVSAVLYARAGSGGSASASGGASGGGSASASGGRRAPSRSASGGKEGASSSTSGAGGGAGGGASSGSEGGGSGSAPAASGSSGGTARQRASRAALRT